MIVKKIIRPAKEGHCRHFFVDFFFEKFSSIFTSVQLIDSEEVKNCKMGGCVERCLYYMRSEKLQTAK